MSLNREYSVLLDEQERSPYTPILQRSSRISLQSQPTRRVSSAPDESGHRETFIMHQFESFQHKSAWTGVKTFIHRNHQEIVSTCLSLLAACITQFLGHHEISLWCAAPGLLAIIYFICTIIEKMILTAVGWTKGYSPWHLQIIVNAASSRIRTIIFFFAIQVVLLHGLFDDNYPVLSKLCTCVYLVSICWIARTVMLAFAKRSATRFAMSDEIAEYLLKRDTLMLLCCPDAIQRRHLRNQWINDPDRYNFANKVNQMRRTSLQLPLAPDQNEDEDSIKRWVYSPCHMIEVTGMRQMRICAKQLMENAYQGVDGNMLKFSDWDAFFGDLPQEDAINSWTSMFGDHMNAEPVSPNDFVVGLYHCFERLSLLSSHLLNFDSLWRLILSLVNAFFAFAMVAVVANVFGEGLAALLVTFGTVFASMAFALSGSITSLFESVMFIFVEKPYQVGDRVMIGGIDYYVHEIELMSTSFRTIDNKIVRMTNSSLAEEPISNQRRSDSAVIEIDVSMAFDTPLEKIQQLKHEMLHYCKLNNDIWKPKIEQRLNNLSDATSIVVQMRFFNELGWQEESVIEDHTFAVTNALRIAMLKVGIETSNPDTVAYTNRKI